MLKSLRLLSSAALIALATPACAEPAPAPARPDADPAVWLVQDEDTKIYLFGTVHALDGTKDWFNDEVRTAFDNSKELVLEVITPDNPAEMQPAILKYALDKSGKPLTAKLSPKGQELLAAELKSLGLPATALDQFKPFFAALTLTTLQFQKMGITPDKGAEAILKAAADERKMAMDSVETVEFQLGLMDGLSEADQLHMLETTLADAGKLPQEIGRLNAAWETGNADKVAELIKETDSDSPALYKLLFTDRNQRWAQWIDDRLDRPGTVFMAVGAGHLAGDDSVQKHLAKRSIQTLRVQPAR